MSALRDSTTPSLVQDNKMIQEARTISKIHDYISVLTASLEDHPENEIMLEQHQHWTRTVQKLTGKFQKKWGKFPVSVVEETL